MKNDMTVDIEEESTLIRGVECDNLSVGWSVCM